MGQVPLDSEAPYLIIGNGRLAKHIKHYFDLLEIPYLHWFRKSSKPLEDHLSRASKILVLIKDDEIENFVSISKLGHERKTWIHCSGLLSTPLAESAHPLMTFADSLYDLETYKSIAFVTEKRRERFRDLFPELPNMSFPIRADQKPFYHAWCVMSGNFTSILWQNFFDTLENDFGIYRKYAFPYLKKIAENLMTNESPLTGPLARNDKRVIDRNLHALKGEPFEEIYKAFVSTYKKLRESESKK